MPMIEEEKCVTSDEEWCHAHIVYIYIYIYVKLIVHNHIRRRC